MKDEAKRKIFRLAVEEVELSSLQPKDMFVLEDINTGEPVEDGTDIYIATDLSRPGDGQLQIPANKIGKLGASITQVLNAILTEGTNEPS